MRKGTSLRIDPFYPADTQDSYLLLNPPSKGHLALQSTTSAIFPYLRKLDIRDEIPSPRAQQKKALLTLKLSSISFLDTNVNDGLSNDPLYTLKTANMCTTLMRYDPWDGSTKIAEIRWPRQVPVRVKGKENLQGVSLRMNGQTKSVESFLKYGTLSGNRSFLIPGYPHTFKWRRSGHSYHCTTSSVKGPVATLDAAVSSVPPRLQIFETLLVQDTRPQLDRGGVALNLIDHLLVTALLLVTDAEEWVMQSRGGPQTSQPVVSIEAPLKSAPASVKQWRKIVYGEPLFPSLRSPNPSHGARGDDPADEDFARPETPASRPASMRQWRKIVYGEPLFPSLNNIQDGRNSEEMVGGRSSHSRSSTPWDDDEEDVDASPSQSSESVNLPSTPASTAPASHGYLDPSFYHSDVPPVPELPDAYKSNSPAPSLLPSSSTNSRHSPSFPASSSSGRRELPKLPDTSPASSSSRTAASSSHTPWLHRSQSTPFLNNNIQPLSIKRKSTEQTRRPPPSDIYSPTHNHRAESPVLSLGGASIQTSSSRRRQLPLPPVSFTPPSALVPKRASTQSDKRRPASASSSGGRSLPAPPRPGTSGETSSRRTLAQEQIVRRSIEKDANEHNAWMQSVASGVSGNQQQPGESDDDEHQPSTDAPPPAYYAIDFSHPPHAAAPSAADPPPPPHPDASPPPPASPLHSPDSTHI